jgi:hypothetical protein
VFCPLCSSVPPVVRPISYAATPSGYTLSETALNSKEIYRPDEIHVEIRIRVRLQAFRKRIRVKRL